MTERSFAGDWTDSRASGTVLLRAAMIVAAAVLALLAGHRSEPAPVPAARVGVDAASWVDPVFGRPILYRPAGIPRGLVLFLSGDGGWRGTVDAMARSLAARGALVAGLSNDRLLAQLERDPRRCAYPGFPLLGLAADIEHRSGFARYTRPVLVGYSAGATLAYGAVAQAPAGSYAGAVSIAFSPDIVGRKPWCPTASLVATRVGKQSSAWLFAPRPVPLPWTILQGTADRVVDAGVARRFASAADATFVPLAGVDHRFADPARWAAPLSAAVLPHLPRAAPAPGRLPTDLPITVVADADAPPTDRMAVLWSGDGGWAGLDRKVAARLAHAGVPVVGIDSLAYFWTPRTPAGTARDLMRIMAGYSRLWHRPRVILIGYSFGANILPHVVGALPADFRRHVVRLGLIGLDAGADFQFHLGSWLDVPNPAALPTLPAVARLRGLDMLCLHGADDRDSACPQIPPDVARDVTMPGGHHLGGDADRIAHDLLADGEA